MGQAVGRPRLDTRRRAGYAKDMIVLVAILLGALTGWTRAARLGGSRADRLQYAAAMGFAFAALGVFLTIILARMG